MTKGSGVWQFFRSFRVSQLRFIGIWVPKSTLASYAYDVRKVCPREDVEVSGIL